MTEKSGFPPIADRRSDTLILGSLPGDLSIRAQEYYANPQNAFWRLIGYSETAGYEEKKQYLRQNGIALWDVLKNAEREGALDSNIKNETANAFDAFFADHPAIRRIFFNGQTAQKLFHRHVRQWETKFSCTVLPSSSPANAGMNFEQKKEKWAVVSENKE